MHLLLVILGWVAAVPAFLVSALCFLANWALLAGSAVRAAKGGGPSFSFVLPLIGPFLGVISFLVVPLSGTARWCWLPVAADPFVLCMAWLATASVLGRLFSRAG